MEYIAHVRRLDDGEWDISQSLEAHLRETAELAASFALDFNSGEWGYALGMAHDAGKSTSEWQNYLCDKSGFGYDEDASSETVPGKVEHSGPSAKLAEEIFGKKFGRFLSYSIAGHHAGLPDWMGPASALAFRLQHAETKNIAQEIWALLNGICPKTTPWQFDPNGLDIPLWIRMLFSCLVDADRLNTEKYMSPEKSRERAGYASIAELHKRFNEYMARKTKQPDGVFNLQVYNARQQVLADCRKAAEMPPGFFSLTVPTGGGKTLSAMAFALKHAEMYGNKRIIYVIPYTSIIEQNADVLREALGNDEIIEHHSNLDEEVSTTRGRLATENWDAPVIVTTSVQFFESLFAAKANRCRKLHNIANSVVILDEAQLIPEGFLKPILATMQLLTEHYRVSFVISTATQPVFEKQKNFPDFPGLPEGSVREIVGNVRSLYQNLKRVTVKKPLDISVAVEWNDLAAELSKFEQVLCIVSDRKSCRELHALMPKETCHLSALMCAQHRSEVINTIKDKLKKGETVRVISTQIVEAGVDIDFPVVYRAMAGLDSIAQAAGRCNREGHLNVEGKLGRVVIFKSPRRSPAGILRKAAETAESMLNQLENPIDHSVFASYFSELYWKANSLDSRKMFSLLQPDFPDCGIQFRSAADAFRIIDDANQRSILVPHGEGETLIGLLKNSKIPERILLRKLQRYTINIYREQFFILQNRGSLEEIIPGTFALNNTVEYSNQVGLLIDEMPDNEGYIC